MSEIFDVDTIDIVEASVDLPVVVGLPVTTSPQAAAAAAGKERALPRLGPYRLIAKFASGMSLVFLAYRVTNLGTQQNAVVKLASRKHSDFDNLREMLIDEARAMSVFDHPNIVRVLETMEGEYGYAVALENVPGIDAASLLAHTESTGDRLPAPLVAYVLSEALRGLEHAHEAKAPDGSLLGIVHRDVTPSNVLLARTGHVKLTDFGVVHMNMRLQKKTAPGIVKGKFAYLAPEYVNGGSLDRRSDLYAAGIMLFELLLGERTLKKNDVNAAAVRELVKRGPAIKTLAASGAPRALVDVVTTATARDPAERFATAREMREAIERWLRGNREWVGPSDLERCIARYDAARAK